MKNLVLIVLLVCGSLYAGEPEKLNIFGRIKRNVKVVTTNTFKVFQKVTPRISFKDDEKAVVDKVRQEAEAKARLEE